MMQLEKANKMSLKEFVDSGYLQEANRKFFHPLGLALSFSIDEERNEISFHGILDCRNESDGIVFLDLSKDSNIIKADFIESELKRIGSTREENFNFVVQPIGHKLE